MNCGFYKDFNAKSFQFLYFHIFISFRINFGTVLPGISGKFLKSKWQIFLNMASLRRDRTSWLTRDYQKINKFGCFTCHISLITIAWIFLKILAPPQDTHQSDLRARYALHCTRSTAQISCRTNVTTSGPQSPTQALHGFLDHWYYSFSGIFKGL